MPAEAAAALREQLAALVAEFSTEVASEGHAALKALARRSATVPAIPTACSQLIITPVPARQPTRAGRSRPRSDA